MRPTFVPRGLVILGCLTAAALVAGCATPKYKVSGKITRGGKPLEWVSDKCELEVTFVPLDRERDKNTYRAQTDRTAGTYTIDAIPAGSYRVSIQQMDPAPVYDLLGNGYGMDNSPILQEVAKKDQQVIDIDLPKDLPKHAKKVPRPQD